MADREDEFEIVPERDICAICRKVVPFANKKKERASGRLSKWDIIKAGEAGWFFQKDGTTWCPEHTPEWVEEWRARQRNG